MRRVARILILVVALWPMSALAQAPHMVPHAAATWFTFTSKSLHFTIRFPRTWKIITPNPATSRQITLYTANGAHDLLVQALPFAAGSSLNASMQHFLAYKRTVSRSGIYSKISWTQTAVGGRAAFVGVLRPSTEGGAPVSDAIYLTQWRGNVVEIVLFANHKPALGQLRQFPPIYFQILSTLRFL